MTFSSDSKHLAFVAQSHMTKGGWELPIEQVVIDGVAGHKYATIKTAFLEPREDASRVQLEFAKDGAHIIYIAIKLPLNPFLPADVQVKTNPVVVIDGKEGPEFERLSNLVLSPDGRRAVYVGGNQENGRLNYHVVENGQPGPGYDGISKVLFSPDSKKLIYFAVNDKSGVMVIDGQETDSHRNYYDMVNGILFSKNVRHMAYLDRDEHNAVGVVLDGKLFPGSAAPATPNWNSCLTTSISPFAIKMQRRRFTGRSSAMPKMPARRQARWCSATVANISPRSTRGPGRKCGTKTKTPPITYSIRRNYRSMVTCKKSIVMQSEKYA